MPYSLITRASAVFVAIAAIAGPAVADDKLKVVADDYTLTVETLADGLDHPWGLAILPDGRFLVTERSGAMRIVDDGVISPPLAGVPDVAARGQGGLLDVVLLPDFATSRSIVFSYSEAGSGGAGTAVARATLDEGSGAARLSDVTVIFQAAPKSGGGRHFGSRIAVAGDGSLFVTLGDRGERERAQEADDHAGSVVRIWPDGRIPGDNPFAATNDALPELWSIGHRNPQSAAIHPETGKLWTVEHGARGGDEVNIPEAGKNYGWPVISYGRHYSGRKIGVGTSADGYEQPVHYWDPSIAPSGMAFYDGDLFPAWRGDLFVGALRGRHLARLDLDGERVIGEEQLLTELNERIRDVRSGPDGALYVLTDSDDGRLIRITAAQ